MRKEICDDGVVGGNAPLIVNATFTRHRVRRNRSGPGYWIHDELVPTFADNPDLTLGERRWIARWAVTETPEAATDEQRRIYAETPKGPSPRMIAAAKREFERMNPDLERITAEERSLAEAPARHPALAGRKYPLSETELATLVGAPVERVREWAAEKEIIGRPVGVGVRDFYMPAAIRAFALARGVAVPRRRARVTPS